MGVSSYDHHLYAGLIADCPVMGLAKLGGLVGKIGTNHSDLTDAETGRL